MLWMLLLAAASAASADRMEPWWSRWDDPHLEATVDRGLQGNRSLDAARWQARQAAANAHQARGALLPQVTADARLDYAPTDSLGFGLGVDPSAFGGPPAPDAEPPPELYSTGSAKLNGSWGIDAFGARTHAWLASTDQAAAQRASADAVALRTARSIAEAYFDAVLANQQLAVVEEQRAATRLLTEAVQQQYDRGAVGALDLLQQQQLLASVDAQVPQIEASTVPARQRLAVLLGLEAVDDPGPLAEVLPEVPSLPPWDAGHLPTVAAASAQAEVSVHQRKSAVASLLPTVRVHGNVGWTTFDQGEFDSLFVYGFGASVSLPVFDGGQRVASLRAARRAERAQKANLEQTRADAEQRIASARHRDEALARQLAAARRQASAAAEARDQAQAQYLAGTATYVQLLSAITTAQSAELSALRVHRDRLGARLDWLDATGGTWSRDLALATEGQTR